MNKWSIPILKALAKYKFLTYKQMLRLGIGTSESNLSNDFDLLMKRRNSLASKFPFIPTVSAKHFLTSHGRKYLIKNTNLENLEIKYFSKPPEKDNLQADHRTATIDCQIGLDLACQKDGLDVVFCDTYFDKVDNDPFNKKHKSKTSILMDAKNAIRADLAFMLETPKQRELYFLELENGNDSKKALEKCKNFGKAIYYGHANKKYKFQSGYRTLWVFVNESTMKNTIKRISKDSFFDQLNEYFLFKSLDKVQSDNFFQNWLNIKSQKRKLFYK